MPVPLFQLEHIRKTFPGAVANDDVSLSLHEGAIHSVIGENGAGKSTLMGILYGRFQPDSGRILHRGEVVRIPDPSAAIALGIGMVTQHTTMIPALTTLENIVLGCEPSAFGGVIDHGQARRKLTEIAEGIGIRLDWNTPAESLSVASLQKAEIVKALFRGARVLILDEPTATLSPLEAESLFALIHSLAAEGTTVVFVTHKLREVMAHAATVTVMRAGRVVGNREIRETESRELLALMLGATTADPETLLLKGELPEPQPRDSRSRILQSRPSSHRSGSPVLEVRRLTVKNDRRAEAVRSVSLSVPPGEILGVAGVDGSGQRELAQAIVGLRRSSGQILVNGRDISKWSIADRQREGIAYIPEDRHREGLILDFTVAENMLLGKQRLRGFGGGITLNPARIRANGETAIHDHRIRAAGGNIAVKTLSGGNQQKVLVARALESTPRVMIAMQPTRGLDVEATRFIYSLMDRARADGMGVLLFSLDMDEILGISDRIAVMYNGEIVATLPRKEAAADEIGRIMVEGRP